MFKGRISRGQYWGAVLMLVLYFIILGLVALVATMFVGGIAPVLIDLGLLLILYLLAMVFGIGLQIRRLHDIGLTGWIVLLFVISNIIFVSVAHFMQGTSVALICSGLYLLVAIAGLVISLWKGNAGVNAYGAPVAYTSWTKALLGIAPSDMSATATSPLLVDAPVSPGMASALFPAQYSPPPQKPTFVAEAPAAPGEVPPTPSPAPPVT